MIWATLIFIVVAGSAYALFGPRQVVVEAPKSRNKILKSAAVAPLEEGEASYEEELQMKSTLHTDTFTRLRDRDIARSKVQFR